MEPQGFLAGVAPFAALDPTILEHAAADADVVYFKAGVTIGDEGTPAEHLHVIVQGAVQEFGGADPVARHAAGDYFDAEALLRGHLRSRFVAREDTICCTLPRAAFLALLERSPAFATQVFDDIAERASAVRTDQAHRDLASFMVAKIADAYIHPPLIVPASASIRDAAIGMKQNKATSLLVDRDGEIGICSGTDLRNAVVIDGVPADHPVGSIASYALVCLDADDFLFNALLAMTRHSISRIVIKRDGIILGVLEQVDLLGFLSSHSHLIAVQIERASSREELALASRNLTGVIEALNAKGVKLRYIGQLLAELNKKLFAKLFALLAPPELIANSCLIVMGSEGREEQILKTDQDNALILRDGFTCAELERVVHDFTESLVEFGYPRCPGNIMVSNPYWTKSLTAFKDEIFEWILRPSEESFLHFAIFYDAMPVAGDAALLAEARRYMYQQLRSHQAFLARFAKATVAFETPLGFFANFVLEKDAHRDELDLKKGGIFPLVHGIRSLALEHRLTETNTVERIEALRAKGVLEEPFATELVETLTFLSTLRLKAGLRKLKAGLAQDNYVRPADLNKLEREMLRDSLKIVNEFKKYVSFHFKLNMVS